MDKREPVLDADTYYDKGDPFDPMSVEDPAKGLLRPERVDPPRKEQPSNAPKHNGAQPQFEYRGKTTGADVPPSELFDLSETPTVATEQFDLGPSSAPASTDPAFVKDRAEKFAFGIGEDPQKVHAQLEAGGEYWLREAQANKIALEQKTLRNNMVYDAAKKLNRPLTEADLNDFDALSKARPKVDPQTVLEEAYGSAFSHFLVSSAQDTTVHKEVMNLLPEASLDAMDSVGQAVAKREIANESIKGLEQRHQELANDVTVGNLLKGTGQVIVGALFPSQTNKARETLKGFGLVGDYAKMFLPGYANVKLGGLKVDLGKSLEEQYQHFALMPPSEFKKEFKETVDKLSESSVPLALQYASGYQHYSTTDRNLDTLFGVADWLSVGGTLWSARGAIKRLRAPKELPGTGSGGGGFTPEGGPTPYDTLGVAPNASDDEIKAAFRKAAKESHPDLNPGQDDRFKDVSNAWEILGDKEKRAKYDAGELHHEWSSAKASSRPTAPVDTPAPPVPEATADDQIQYIKDFRQAAKDTVKAANQDTPEEAIAQLGDIDAASEAIAHKRVVDEFTGKDPFNDSLALRDKTVSLFYPHEAATDPGSLTHGQVAKLVAYGQRSARSLLGILNNEAAPVRLTEQQVQVATEMAKKSLLKTYSGVHDAILDVDLGGPFRVYTPEEQRVNVHTVEMRLGQVPTKVAPSPSPSTSGASPLRGSTGSAPIPTKPKTPPSTGDVFTDVVNLHTSTKGRTLVRDLYDTMKKEGSFKGNLAEFRQKISDLRKAGKVKMSAHEGELPKQSPEIKKSVPVGESRPVEEPRSAGSALTASSSKELANIEEEISKRTERVFAWNAQLANDLKYIKLRDKELDALGDIEKRLKDILEGTATSKTSKSVKVVSKLLGMEGKVRELRANKFKERAEYAQTMSETQEQNFLWLANKVRKNLDEIKALEARHGEIGSKATQAQQILDYAKGEPASTQTTSIGEEGNFASEFRRDIGYGNETHRNRIIDSEFIVRPRSKYKSPLRAHYVEPPKGFEPKSAKNKPPVTANYKRAEPTNDEELMSALTDLMNQVAQTDNHDLWTRLSKSLSAVEKRNFRNEQNLGIDTREFDTDLLGSPYAKREPRPASSRRLSEEEQIKYANLEGIAYDYLNSIIKSGKVSYQVKMGTPKASLFKKRDQAAYYGVNVYGLSPNQFRVLQQGNGYYISIAKMVDETHDPIRDLGVTTGNNASRQTFLNAVAGSLVNPDEYIGELSKLNRKVATYGPQEQHRLIQEAAKNLLSMSRQEREDLRDIFIANRDFKYLDDKNKVRRGRFNETFGALEREFFERYNRMPTERQVASYFEYVQLYDTDLAMRDLALVRDVGRLGLEKTSLGYHVPTDVPGETKRKQSKAFAARVVDKLPFDAKDGEDWGVWVYNPHTKSGDFRLRSQIDKITRDDIEDKITNHGFTIMEVGNPLEKPLRNVAKTDENVNFIVVKDFDKRKYDWSNIPRRPGGHVDYQDGHFIKQPIIRRTEASGTLRHIYEGDESLLNLTSEAQAKKLVPQIEIARKLLKEGRMEELERHLAKNTPFELDHWQSLFKPRADPTTGETIPPRFNIDDKFTHTLSGKNTFDMAHHKGEAANYVNFFDAIRSKYNLFANNVDKKYLGTRDPDLPSVFEHNVGGGDAVMDLVPPRLIDPYEVINSSLANVIRSKYLNDVKMQAAENFIQEFSSVMKTPLEEMRRNPVWYLHNPDWDTTTDNLPRIGVGIHVRQAALNMIGTQSSIGKALTWANRKLHSTIYERMGQAPVDKWTDLTRKAVNPLDFMRGMVFHEKLGLFNLIQAFKQGIQVTNAMAIEGPGATWRAAPRAIAARMLALTEDPNVIDGAIAHISKVWDGFDGEHFKEAYLELKKTGLYNVGGEYASRDNFFDPKVVQSKAGWFLDKGTIFFKEGERFPRLMAWFMAYDKWKAANPGKQMNNIERAKVLDRADLLTNNMSRASNANIQAGSFATPTQFWSYKWRLAEQIWGTRLTKKEKTSLILWQLALWGVPVGASAITGWDYYDDIRQASLEAGYPLDDPAVQLLHEGIVSMAISQISGQEYNVAKAYGPSGLNVVKEIFNTPLLETIGGASGSVLMDMIKTSHGVYNYIGNFFDPTHDAPTTQDLIDFTRNISSVNNAIRAYYMWNSGAYITKNETDVVDGPVGDLTGGDAFALFALGLTPTKVGDTFLMIKSNKEKKDAEHAATKVAVKYILRSLRAQEENDDYLRNANMRQAKAALVAAKIPPQEWGGVLKKAYDSNNPLFEKVLSDFVKQSPPDQHDARQKEAVKKMQPKYR